MPHSHKVISIKPRKPDGVQNLSADQLSHIQTVLEQSLPPDSKHCISRSQLYEELKDDLSLEMEQYQFERAITAAIKGNLLVGFATRHGRGGGICRTNAFKSFDEQKPRRKKKELKSCTVTINDVTYLVEAPESQVFEFMVTILEAVPTNDSKNAIYINNGAYKLPANADPARILQKFVSSKFNALAIYDMDSDAGHLQREKT